MQVRQLFRAAAVISVAFSLAVGTHTAHSQDDVVRHNTIEIRDLNIFYREAGDPSAPTILLLHGFPTSSQMFADLMPALADDYHLVAPDYPGFGNSSMPAASEFDYTFDNLTSIVDEFTTALKLDKYSLYVMDYGAPIGFRLAAKYPERVQSLIVQNGNAYEEGLGKFWEPFRTYWQTPNAANADQLRAFLKIDVTRLQYVSGARNEENISPDNWIIDQYGLDRPGNQEVQLELFFDYRTNPPLYEAWHQYFQQYQPPTLVVWGRNDFIFETAGALAFARDLKDVEIHLLNTGHFALAEDSDLIALLIYNFLARTFSS